MTGFLEATEVYREGQRTLPGHYYTSPEIYAVEQERIFAERWVCQGRAAEVSNPGDYVLRTIAGESVIVVRGRDGALRSFYNVCRHRGTRLCEDPRGRFSETIQCPYHAWTYTIDGRLIGAPHMDEVAGFEKRDYPLHAVALETWEGFAFLSLVREPEPLLQTFAPLVGRSSRFNLPNLRRARRDGHHVRVAVPPRLGRRTRLRSGGRGGFLGRDQPSGLAHLRAEPGGDRLPRLPARGVLAAGGDIGGVGP